MLQDYHCQQTNWASVPFSKFGCEENYNYECDIGNRRQLCSVNSTSQYSVVTPFLIKYNICVHTLWHHSLWSQTSSLVLHILLITPILMILLPKLKLCLVCIIYVTETKQKFIKKFLVLARISASLTVFHNFVYKYLIHLSIMDK